MGLVINVTYDSSVSSAPAGFTTAVAAAVAFYEHAFKDNISVNITVGWDETNGTPIPAGQVAHSLTFVNFYTYAQVQSALATHETSPDDVTGVNLLPASDPANGGRYDVSLAEARALGLSTSTGNPDGYIGLSSAYTYTFDPNNRSVSGSHDAIGAIEHEISEVLGRRDSLGQAFGTNIYTPLDLYRYSSAGARDLTPGPGSFSVDGQTLLLPFNDPTKVSGDMGDWDSSIKGDAYGDSYSGQASLVTPADMRAMDVIGYDRMPASRDDFTGDATSDVLWSNSSTGDFGYWAIGGGQAAWHDMGTLSTAYSVAGTGDFDGNGTADIILRNGTTGDTGIWTLSLTGQTSWNDLGAVATSYDVAGAGDFTGDGTADILWRSNVDGDTGFWTMSGGKATAWHDFGHVSTAYHVVDVGDFNGDGKSDILWQDAANGDTGIFLLNGSGQASWLDLGQVSFAYPVVGVGDFNGDGTADILFRNSSTGDIGYWAMNSAGQAASWHDLGFVQTTYQVAGMGDYNADGTTDILWREPSTGDTGYWAMNGGQAIAWRDLGTMSTAFVVPATA